MTRHALFPYQLYLVISDAACQGRDFLKVAEQAIAGGVEIIQLREKNLDTSRFTEKALRLKEITDKYNVPLIINDNVEVANSVQAFGVHVGNNDTSPAEIRARWGNQWQIGYSIEYLSQLDNEKTTIADHLGISPVFSTATKTDTVTEWGLAGIKKIRSLTDKPLIAIGNINARNAVEVIQAGADCIAVVSAICSAENPEEAARNLRKIIAL